MTGRYFFSVILLICVATAAAQELLCPYIFVTRTAAATGAFYVNLNFHGPLMTRPLLITNISRYNVLGTHYESFQSGTVDVFFFEGPCEHYCNVSLDFHGARASSSWIVDLFILRASLDTTGCDFTKRYPVYIRLHGRFDTYAFNFCNPKAVGTEKQKLTGASLLRLVGMPSYTT